MMVSTLKPGTAVACPLKNQEPEWVSVCRECMHATDVRIPWRHYAVKCAIGNENGGVYP